MPLFPKQSDSPTTQLLARGLHGRQAQTPNSPPQSPVSRRRMPAIPSRCRWSFVGTEHRAMPTRIAHAPSATDTRQAPASMTPIDPSRSPAHTSSDPPAAPKIAMPMSTCLRNARGRRTDTTATATSAAPFANVHSSRMKESCVSYRGNRCTFSDQLLNVSNANARPCANENKPAFGGATPSPFCSRDLNMPVL